MRRLPFLLTLALGAFAPSALPLHAWGAAGHRMVAAGALQDLPPLLAAWFQGREDQLPAHANDPDHWKAQDAKEGPRHFLDTESYGGPAEVPHALAAAEARLGGAAFQQDGQLPWVILERVGTLAGAFLAGDRDRAAFQASILCHYVGDLHVPLHTTRNHDGQESGQRGVHHRWETGLVDRLGDWIPEARPAFPDRDALQAPWQWLEDSYVQVDAVLADDRAASRTATLAKSDDYWRIFQSLEESRVKEQLSRAAQDTARMIQLAWVLAGRPEAP